MSGWLILLLYILGYIIFATIFIALNEKFDKGTDNDDVMGMALLYPILVPFLIFVLLVLGILTLPQKLGKWISNKIK